MPLILKGNDPISIVSFASLGAKNFDDIKPDEFRNTLAHFDCDQIYVSDITKQWYCTGIDDINNGINGAVEFLTETIGSNNSIFMGHSMGGFAAGLYGMLCGADVVLAFSPQTYITDDDTRYRRYMRNIYPKRSWTDIDNLKTELVVINNNKSMDDQHHIKHIFGINNVHLIDPGGHSHNTARDMRNNKTLIPLIEEYYLKLL